jgi:hypothetical protein
VDERFLVLGAWFRVSGPEPTNDRGPRTG